MSCPLSRRVNHWKKKDDSENLWARTYLALALQMAGRQTEARETGEEVLKRGL
jgi:hypothetical protein